MKRSILFTIFLFVLLFSTQNCNIDASKDKETVMAGMYKNMDVNPPVANKVPKELVKFDDKRIDDYYWLNQREDKNVIDYLNAENDYTKKVLSHTESFQKELFDEIVGRIKQTDESVPYKDNGYFYMVRYEEGKEYPIYARKSGSLENAEEIMLDGNQLAKPYSFYRIGGRSVSPNNKILVYGEDTLSRRIYTLKFKNLETGEYYKDEIPNTSGGATWANDNKTVYYSIKDETLRPYQIWKHTIGQPTSDDKLVYQEEDDTFASYVYKSKSKKYIIIGSFQTLSSEYRILSADDPNGSFKVFQPRIRNLEYGIAHYGDKFYIRTNLDAKNFRLMSTPESQTSKENWTEVIAHRSDVLLESMDIFKDYLVLSERIKGITNIRVMPWEGQDHYIKFGEDSYLSYVSTNPEFETNVLRIGYQSMTTPNSTFDYNMKSKDKVLLKQQEVIGDFDPANYTSERIYAKARDGVEIPISIVYRKGLEKDGSNPCLLYGYGSYGNSMDPYFSSPRLSLLDRGFVYAIAHIRGGEEMGRHWYEDGKLLNKKNTFTDFIDCGKHLVAHKYAGEEALFAMGGSAGGLLMGAVINMEPEMWKGVVAAVPFVDVVTTMLDETIPLTTGEYDEWGNPNEKEYYEYIKSYSPYDNVSKQDYPALLVTTGLHDSQVQYWEPAKWVAKLRDYKTDKHPLLLHCNMETGHGGASGRFERYKEVALDYAFILDLAGKNELLN